MKTAIDQIIQATAEEFGVIPQSIRGRNRCELLSFARQAAMYLAWKYSQVADRTLGYYFGKRTGHAISYARNNVPFLLKTNKNFRQAYENIESKINL